MPHVTLRYDASRLKKGHRLFSTAERGEGHEYAKAEHHGVHMANAYLVVSGL